MSDSRIETVYGYATLRTEPIRWTYEAPKRAPLWLIAIAGFGSFAFGFSIAPLALSLVELVMTRPRPFLFGLVIATLFARGR